MKKYEKPRLTSQDSAVSVINSDNSPESKISDLDDQRGHFATNPGYEADE
jgi:hypothetical protein